jgi:hypothetical protein
MNPFRYGQVVTKDNYCSRPDLEKTLRSRLRAGQNTVIEGERRTGKTSLIFETVAKARSRWLVYIDLLEVKSVEDIHKRMLNGIAKARSSANVLQNVLKKAAALRPALTFDPLTGMPSISIDAAVRLGPDSLEGMLDLFAGKEFRNASIVIDEFQDIRNVPDSAQALAIMRSKIQFLEALPFVFCGSIRRDMHTIFTDPQSPFFKSALPIEVGPIDRRRFRRFITEKFQNAKIAVSSATVDRIFDLADANPGDTQQLCSALYDVYEPGEQISEDSISRALHRIFAQERKGYESNLAKITVTQLKCLSAVAKAGGKHTSSGAFMALSGVANPSSIRKALKRLEELKILFTVQNEYRFVNPFFGRWLVAHNF